MKGNHLYSYVLLLAIGQRQHWINLSIQGWYKFRRRTKKPLFAHRSDTFTQSGENRGKTDLRFVSHLFLVTLLNRRTVEHTFAHEKFHKSSSKAPPYNGNTEPPSSNFHSDGVQNDFLSVSISMTSLQTTLFLYLN